MQEPPIGIRFLIYVIDGVKRVLESLIRSYPVAARLPSSAVRHDSLIHVGLLINL